MDDAEHEEQYRVVKSAAKKAGAVGGVVTWSRSRAPPSATGKISAFVSGTSRRP
jgi:oxalate decarboxylase/phosphoglucose isomerase-like protein (cupin superfamily)